VACYRQGLLTDEKPAMNDKPLVSVVVIFLNAADFIEEAIESVIAQTFADWELLLVDDGSTDASTGIAKAYAARHPGRVFYLTHEGRENRGMSASRNLGHSARAG
jgi:glycosyltransferase involved in cell wall biosynthesis